MYQEKESQPTFIQPDICYLSICYPVYWQILCSLRNWFGLLILYLVKHCEVSTPYNENVNKTILIHLCIFCPHKIKKFYFFREINCLIVFNILIIRHLPAPH